MILMTSLLRIKEIMQTKLHGVTKIFSKGRGKQAENLLTKLHSLYLRLVLLITQRYSGQKNDFLTALIFGATMWYIFFHFLICTFIFLMKREANVWLHLPY
jgi:hypothetical protein